MLCFSYAFSLKIGIKSSVNISPKEISTASMPVLANIYDPLLVIYKGLLSLGSAKSVKVRGKKIFFEIESKYHDGREVKPQHFLGSFKDLLLHPEYKYRYFVIKNGKKFSEGLCQFEDVGIFIKDNFLIIELEHAVEDPMKVYGPIFAFVALVPEGYNGLYYPYKVSEERLILKRNPYHKDVAFEEIEFIVVKEGLLERKLFYTGGLDLILRPSINYFNLEHLKPYGGNMKLTFLYVNQEKVDLTFRRALAQSIDRENMSKFFKGIAAYSIVPYGVKGYKSEFRSEFGDKLFKYSPKNFEKSLTILCANSPLEVKVAEYIQANLKKLNLNVIIKKVPNILKKDLLKSGNYEVAIGTWSIDHSEMPIDFFLMVDFKQADEIWKALSEEYRISKKYQLLSLIERIFCCNFPIIPLFFSRSSYASSKDIKLYSGASGVRLG